MSQKNVQLVIGRLLTDEDLRRAFVQAPYDTLLAMTARGWELTPGEIDALLETDSALWEAVAHKLPSRLQRCSMRTDT